MIPSSEVTSKKQNQNLNEHTQIPAVNLFPRKIKDMVLKIISFENRQTSLVIKLLTFTLFCNVRLSPTQTNFLFVTHTTAQFCTRKT